MQLCRYPDIKSDLSPSRHCIHFRSSATQVRVQSSFNVSSLLDEDFKWRLQQCMIFQQDLSEISGLRYCQEVVMFYLMNKCYKFVSITKLHRSYKGQYNVTRLRLHSSILQHVKFGGWSTITHTICLDCASITGNPRYLPKIGISARAP